MRFNWDLCVLENTMFWPHVYNVKSSEINWADWGDKKLM
jgi:hypothetical protein